MLENYYNNNNNNKAINNTTTRGIGLCVLVKKRHNILQFNPNNMPPN